MCVRAFAWESGARDDGHLFSWCGVGSATGVWESLRDGESATDLVAWTVRLALDARLALIVFCSLCEMCGLHALFETSLGTL